MARKKVSSSKIRAIGYDQSTQILEVEFNSGSVMQYSYVSLLTAPPHDECRISRELV